MKPAVPSASRSASRSAWIDNVRTFVVLLVVNMHACVTYSHVGGWYMKEPPEPALSEKIPFLYWQGHLQSFFMGLLFFFGGVFAHGACARRGPVGFVRERLFRLGLPALLYMVVIHPFMVYVLLRKPHWRPSGELYLEYLTTTRVLSGNGPLWFAIALLIFSAVLAGWRGLMPSATPAENKPAPRATAVFGFAILLALSTFLIRLVQPLDSNIFNMQLCFFPQYMAAFSVGVLAGKHGWLEPLASSRLAATAGWLGLILGPVMLTAVIVLGGIIKTGDFAPYRGGWHWQAFGLASWEQLSGVALGLGVMSLFHRKFTSDGPLARWLANHSFGVYVLHGVVLVALTPLLRPIPGGLVVKVLILTAVGLVASHAVAKLVPGLKRIL
jgi:glucan biosynthesis protein C